MLQYFIINKPYGMLSQFTREGNNQSLADLGFAFSKDIYPVGRLDADSEGLLILTNDSTVNQLLLQPEQQHWRKYLIQVEGSIQADDAARLESGVLISINGKKYKTNEAKASILDVVPQVPERNPPVRFRKLIPTSWLTLELAEGKNRQVRKMTAAIGFPTLRLIRVGISGIELGDMKSGEIREIDKKDFFSKLRR